MPFSTFRLRSAIAASVALVLAPAHGADCPMLPLAEVAKAFNDPEARLDHADPAGFCHWLVGNGLLSASVHRRPSALEATQFFLSYKTTSFAALTRNPSNPKIGQLAYFGMSKADDEVPEAGFMSLNGDTLLVLNYRPDAGLDSGIAKPMIALGAIATGQAANAAQSHGACEWLTKEDARAMLGPGELVIDRLGERHCVASYPADGASLSVMTTEDVDERGFAGLMAQEAARCKTVPLPQFGAHAIAIYACPAPGNTAMTIHLHRKATTAMLVFSPSKRAAKAGDLKTLLPIAERAYRRLGQ